MSTLSLRLPESLHEKVRELAEQEDTSINQFITVAVAEKMSALVAEEYLTERAKRGSREKLRSVLAKVRDVEAIPGDELPEGFHPRAGRTLIRPPLSRGRGGGVTGAGGPARKKRRGG